jgi:hypothetical protein
MIAEPIKPAYEPRHRLSADGRMARRDTLVAALRRAGRGLWLHEIAEATGLSVHFVVEIVLHNRMTFQRRDLYPAGIGSTAKPRVWVSLHPHLIAWEPGWDATLPGNEAEL